MNMGKSFQRSLIALLLVLCSERGSAIAAQDQSVGEVSFANSGAAAAQPTFLRGLAQLHNFEYDSAAELFREAQRIDPGFALAYWGEAMTYNHPVWMEQDISSARKALARLGASAAERLAKAKTEREKAFVGAVELLYGAGDKYSNDRSYAEAMESIYRKYPSDPEAATFYALALLGTAHEGRNFAVYMRAAAILEPMFRDHPNHPGAAHYLIHCYDDPIHAPLGLRAARAYSKIAPAAGHALHMCSHIFLAIGMWDDTVAANETALKVVNDQRARAGRSAAECGHYNEWLEYGYLEQGRLSEARRILMLCYAAARAATPPPADAVLETLDPDNSPAGSFLSMQLRYLLDTEEWSGDIAGLALPAAPSLGSQITLVFTKAFVSFQRKNKVELADAVTRFRELRKTLDDKLMAAGPDSQAYGGRAAVMDLQLSGLLKLLDGGTPDGLTSLRNAAETEAKLPMEFGPPFVDKPSYELLGDVLLSLDKPKEAREAFEKGLAATPGRTASLLGLMRAARRSGDLGKAATVAGQLREIWHAADRMPDDVTGGGY